MKANQNRLDGICGCSLTERGQVSVIKAASGLGKDGTCNQKRGEDGTCNEKRKDDDTCNSKR